MGKRLAYLYPPSAGYTRQPKKDGINSIAIKKKRQ